MLSANGGALSPIQCSQTYLQSSHCVFHNVEKATTLPPKGFIVKNVVFHLGEK